MKASMFSLRMPRVPIASFCLLVALALHDAKSQTRRLYVKKFERLTVNSLYR